MIVQLGEHVMRRAVCRLIEWGDLDCPSAQGYLFGRPLPAAEFAQMLRQGAEQAA